MKILGCAMIIICSSASGIISANTILKRCNICGELMSFCELLKNEIIVRQTPVCDIVNSVKMRDSFRLVTFLSDEYVKNHMIPDSILSKSQNEKIGDFLYSLGKSDISSQLTLIDEFKQFIINAQEEYLLQYKSKSRLYIMLGACSGIIISLTLI